MDRDETSLRPGDRDDMILLLTCHLTRQDAKSAIDYNEDLVLIPRAGLFSAKGSVNLSLLEAKGAYKLVFGLNP